jgi:hypothetical protein
LVWVVAGSSIKGLNQDDRCAPGQDNLAGGKANGIEPAFAGGAKELIEVLEWRRQEQERSKPAAQTNICRCLYPRGAERSNQAGTSQGRRSA